MANRNVEIQRIRYGIHSIVKVTCKGYKNETVYQGAYLATILTVNDPESEIIQQILDDIKGIKGIDGKPYINTITMYTEDDFGERHIFFDLDDCENVIFGKDGENE